MLSLAILLSAARLALCLNSVPAIEYHENASCTAVAYNKTEYECYQTPTGPALCPIVNGMPFELCGSECFTQYQYSCNYTTNILFERAVYHGPVTLKAVNPTAAFNGLPLNAQNSHMYVAANNTAFCPTDVVPADECPAGNTTVLLGSGLAVEVPGGQEMYLQTDGAWAYTLPHTTSTQNLSVYGAGVPYVNAGYAAPNGSDWFACPSGVVGTWQVYAGLENVTLGEDCEGFYAVVEDLPLGTVGAWEY